MREFKFRAYKPEHGGDKSPVMTKPFTFGSLQDKEDFSFTDGMYSSWDEFELEHEDCVIMQFTGLVDKDGVDIYEGDIVSNHMVNPKLGKVIYRKGGFNLQAVKNFRCIYDDLATSDCDKVVGNIYENAEVSNNE